MPCLQNVLTVLPLYCLRRNDEVNYIMSQLMRPNPKFPRLLSKKELTSTIRPDLHSPSDLCCLSSQAFFFLLVIYIFIRPDLSLTSFNFFFFSSRQATREWAAICRVVQYLTLAGEKCAEAALSYESVGINLASAAFTHSLSPSTLPPPPHTYCSIYLQFNNFIFFLSFLFISFLSHVSSCWQCTDKMVVKTVKLRGKRRYCSQHSRAAVIDLSLKTVWMPNICKLRWSVTYTPEGNYSSSIT